MVFVRERQKQKLYVWGHRHRCQVVRMPFRRQLLFTSFFIYVSVRYLCVCVTFVYPTTFSDYLDMICLAHQSVDCARCIAVLLLLLLFIPFFLLILIPLSFPLELVAFSLGVYSFHPSDVSSLSLNCSNR